MMNIFRELRNYSALTQEELADKLSVNKHTVALYEIGRSKPLFKTLGKMSDFFEVSLDYLINPDECQYVKNLKIFCLASKLDKGPDAETRQNTKGAIKSLLSSKPNPGKLPKQDVVDIKLATDFHQNLKEIRKYKGLTQLELANRLNISRALVAQYELDCYPNSEKLMQISQILDISIHALSTGDKLVFDFNDHEFGQAILAADHTLSLEQHKILITLMEAVLGK